MTEQPPSGLAFALARAGNGATQRLAGAQAAEGIAPPHHGVLRQVGQHQGISQQEVAVALGVAPSRVVALVDDLEAKGLVERRRSSRDRRVSELSTPPGAKAALARIRKIVRDHDATLAARLTVAEREQLLGLLQKVTLDPES
ncbi:MAG: MarR family winged helix-turn-helix transcriptional regulator [Aquihabitans sp.]